MRSGVRQLRPRYWAVATQLRCWATGVPHTQSTRNGVFPTSGGVIGGVILCELSANNGRSNSDPVAGLPMGQWCNQGVPARGNGLCGARGCWRMWRASVVGWKHQDHGDKGHIWLVGETTPNTWKPVVSQTRRKPSNKFDCRSASGPGLDCKQWGGVIPTPLLDRNNPTTSSGHGCVARAAPRYTNMRTWPRQQFFSIRACRHTDAAPPASDRIRGRQHAAEQLAE